MGRTNSTAWRNRRHQQPCPRQQTLPFHPARINQRRKLPQRISQQRHTSHPQEVAEAKPTEAVGENQAVVEAAVVNKDFAAGIVIARRLERPPPPAARDAQPVGQATATGQKN